MANVKAAMEYAAKIDREALEERLGKWVGLTEEEVNSIYKVVEKVVGEHWENGGTKLMFPFTLYEALEAKLRSRNGG